MGPYRHDPSQKVFIRRKRWAWALRYQTPMHSFVTPQNDIVTYLIGRIYSEGNLRRSDTWLAPGSGHMSFRLHNGKVPTYCFQCKILSSSQVLVSSSSPIYRTISSIEFMLNNKTFNKIRIGTKLQSHHQSVDVSPEHASSCVLLIVFGFD